MAMVKGKDSLGERTGSDLFYTKGPEEAPSHAPGGTMAYKFCVALLKAGQKGITREFVRKKAGWNPKGYDFKETYARLIREEFAFEYEKYGKYLLTPKGIEIGKNWGK
jgi:hypothetical protein